MRELNVVAFGASRSGKTQLISRYTQHTFSNTYEATIEELYKKEASIDGRFTALQVLDTQGVEQFRAMRDTYINNADGFIITYDTTDVGSLSELENLTTQIMQIKPQITPIVVVGTKTDKVGPKEASTEAIKIGTRLASNIGKPHLTVSAKQNRQVGAVFESLIRQNLRSEAFSRQNTDAASSTMSSVSIDGWLHSQQDFGGANTPRNQPSLKKSMLKLKRSMAKIKGSKSMRNIRKAISTASFHKPSASPSSYTLSEQACNRRYNSAADAVATASERETLPNTLQYDARSKDHRQAEPLSTLRGDVDSDDPNLRTVDQSNLSELPNILDVSEQPSRQHRKEGVCVIM